MSDTEKKVMLKRVKAASVKKKEVLPLLIPYLAQKGQMLMPGGLLPLHIKTPNDRRMVERALMRKRTIGVIQPREETKTEKKLYRVGCVGRITTFSEKEDGSFYVVLKGLKRFKALAENAGLLKVDYSDYLNEGASRNYKSSLDRQHLMSLLKGYLSHIDLDVNWSDIQGASDESLTTSLAMMCPFEASEKQAILESGSLKERIEMITAFIEMSDFQKVTSKWSIH